MQAPAPARRVAELGLLAGPVGAAALWVLHGTSIWTAHLPAASWRNAILLLLVAPVIEELAFRGGLQDLCRAAMRHFELRDTGVVSVSNLLTSVLFAAAHFQAQPAALAFATVLPSLVLGRLREVSGAVWPCVLLHAWFNTCFLLISVFPRR